MPGKRRPSSLAFLAVRSLARRASGSRARLDGLFFDPAHDLASDARDRDTRELPGHALLDPVVDLGQDALDVLSARAIGVGLAAGEGEQFVLGLDGAEDVQERDPLGV